MVEHTETAVFILRVRRFTLWQPNLTVLYKGKFIHSSVSATNPKHGFSVNRNFSSSAKSWRVLSHPQSLASFPPSPPSPKKWFTDRHSSSETSARQPSVYQDFCRLECGVMYLTNSVWFFIFQLAKPNVLILREHDLTFGLPDTTDAVCAECFWKPSVQQWCHTWRAPLYLE